MTLHGIILHDGLWRVTKHLSYVEVEWLHAVALLEREVGIASSLTNDIQWSTLALGNLTYMFNVLLVNQQAHTFLTLVGDNLLRAQSLVTDRQLSHINLTAALLNEL